YHPSPEPYPNQGYLPYPPGVNTPLFPPRERKEFVYRKKTLHFNQPTLTESNLTKARRHSNLGGVATQTRRRVTCIKYLPLLAAKAALRWAATSASTCTNASGSMR